MRNEEERIAPKSDPMADDALAQLLLKQLQSSYAVSPADSDKGEKDPDTSDDLAPWEGREDLADLLVVSDPGDPNIDLKADPKTDLEDPKADLKTDAKNAADDSRVDADAVLLSEDGQAQDADAKQKTKDADAKGDAAPLAFSGQGEADVLGGEILSDEAAKPKRKPSVKRQKAPAATQAQILQGEVVNADGNMPANADANADGNANAGAPDSDTDPKVNGQDGESIFRPVGDLTFEDLMEKVSPDLGMPKAEADYSTATAEEVYGQEHKVKDPAAKAREGQFEYQEEFQREGIIAAYRKRTRRLNHRLIALGVLFVLTLLFECGHSLLPSFADPVAHPGIHLLLDDLFALSAMLIVWTPFTEGLLSVIRRRPQPKSLLFLVYAVTALYQIIALIGGALDTVQYSAVTLVFLALCVEGAEWLELRQEIFSFAQMSEGGEKLLLRRGADAGTYYAQTTEFVSDYYHNRGNYPKARKQTYWYLISTLLFFVAFLVLPLSMGYGFFSALRCGYFALLLSAPALLCFFFVLPTFFLFRRLYYHEDAMIISEEAVEELTEANAVEITDACLLDESGLRVTDFKIYGNQRVDYAMQCAAGVLDCIDCSLAIAFCRGVSDLGYSKNHTHVVQCADGVSCVLDGTHRVEFGTVNYMRRQNYVIAANPVHDRLEASGQVGIAYLAVDGAILATMHIHYKVSKELLERMYELSQAGVSLILRSSDPILNETILRQCIPEGNSYRIFLQKAEQYPDPLKKTPRADGIAMTVAQNELKLLDLILAAFRLRRKREKTGFALTVFTIVTLFVMAVLQNPCLDRVLHSTTILPIVYQLFGGGVLWLLTKDKRENKSKNDANEG